MRVSIRAKPRLLAAGVFASALALAGAGQAAAQSVFFSGFTAGCFDPGCTPTTSPSTLGTTLTFNPTTFSTTTVGGVGSTVFGQFTLANNAPFTFTGHSFTLLVTFIDPSSNTNIFTASLTGRIVTPTSGGVFMDFDNNTQSWLDSNGRYTVRVDDTRIDDGGTVIGHLTAKSVPEPISMILIGTGLAGLGVASRRRKRQEADLI